MSVTETKRELYDQQVRFLGRNHFFDTDSDLGEIDSPRTFDEHRHQKFQISLIVFEIKIYRFQEHYNCCVVRQGNGVDM